MKCSNEYFQKYSSRAVEHSQSSGLFYVDGHSIPRSLVEDERKVKDIRKRTAANYLSADVSPNFHKSSLNPLSRSITNVGDSTNCNSPGDVRKGHSARSSAPRVYDNSFCAISPKRPQSTTTVQPSSSSKGHYGMYTKNIDGILDYSPPSQYYSRFPTPVYEKVTDRVTIKIRTDAQLIRKIFHDDNFVEVHEARKHFHAGNRLWFPTERRLKSIDTSWKMQVPTPVPSNKKLGLTPLRLYAAQDKPHHLSKWRKDKKLIVS